MPFVSALRGPVLTFVLLACSLLAVADDRPVGSSEVFAATPVPGFPEGIAIRGNRVYVAGPATFGQNTVPAVLAFDLKSKALVAQ
jgi:hypothetical protein